MTDLQVKNLLMALLHQIDYDIAKSFDPETAEEPEYAEQEMQRLIKFYKNYIKTHSVLRNR